MQGRRRAIRAADIRSRPRFLLGPPSALRSDAKLEAAQKDEYAQQLTSVLHQSQ
ncbi:hypothetical protein E4U50_006500, partial [Claviceps purpurea]